MRSLPVVLLLLLGCTAAPPVRVVGEAFDVLEQVREAIGADALFAARDGMTLRGVRTQPASSGTSPVSLSLRPSGSFLASVGGAQVTTRAFDGSDAWVRRPSGIVRHLELGSREHMLADGWLRTHLWLVPGAERFEVEVDDDASTPTRLALRLTRDDGRIEASYEIDRLTMLPAAYELARFGRARRVTFADWIADGPIAGARYAQTIEERVAGNVTQIDRYETATAGTPSTFRAPLADASDATYAQTSRGTLPTRVDSAGRFHVRVEIDGERVAWMLVDSGFGAHALRRDVAESLGLVASGDANLAGVGGSSSGSWCTAGSLVLGPLTVEAPRFALLDGVFEDDVAGVLGAPLFERAVVALDDRSGTVTIYDPRRFRGEDVQWHPVLRDGTAPCVEGRVLSKKLWREGLLFRLDTGSDDTLTVPRWAGPALALEVDRARLRPTSLVGLFGQVEGWRVLVDGIEFAGARLGRTELSLLRDRTEGPLSDPWIAGNLGMGALRGRRLLIDLTRDRVSISGAD